MADLRFSFPGLTEGPFADDISGVGNDSSTRDSIAINPASFGSRSLVSILTSTDEGFNRAGLRRAILLGVDICTIR